MIVISDCSPITNLLVVNRLELLKQLYSALIIPPAVCRELSDFHSEHFTTFSSLSFPWIQPRSLSDRQLARSLQRQLDLGEAEAIALAAELSADMLLIDEHRGRETATRLGLGHTGILGVLLEVKSKGLLDQIQPALDDLIARSGFWVHPGLYRQVLELAGEG